MCAELVSQMYAASFSVPVAIARCSNIYGGGDLNVGRVIPGLVMAGLAGEPFTIRNGRAIFDFLYVDDAVEALLLMAEAMAAEDAMCGQAWNVAQDSPRAVAEVARLTWALMGRTDSDLHILDNGGEESGRLEGAKARPLPGWAPRTEIIEGLEKTIRWYACNSGQPRSCASAPAPL
jgi:CDP-glucose 4,6-dehydratase